MPGTEIPFQISIPEEKIQNLKEKLALTVFPDELENVGWEYGVPLADVKRLVAHWRDGYDWRKHETALNRELPQFTRDIEVEGHGMLNIHYVHKKSDVVDAIPLLFVHGWPGSFLEVRKILPLLTQSLPDTPSFHVVAFSLPGYGFSEAPKKKRFAIDQFAEVGHKLMATLGYNEYVTQGGDWGSVITRKISLLYGSKYAKAWHTNLPQVPPPHPINQPWLYLTHVFWGYGKEDKEALERTAWFRKRGNGYMAEQSTQPQTLSYSLADSPAGLLAWIYEKLINWTDNYDWDDDEVLTWISIYWFSRAGPAASLRIYYEVNITNEFGDYRKRTPAIPTGYSYFPKELVRFPRRWLQSPHLVFESKHARGGHFAAHEAPEELVGDLRKMFNKDGPAHFIISGKTRSRL